MSEAGTVERTSWLRAPGLRVGIVASLVLLLAGFVSIVWVPYPIETVDVGAAMQDFSGAHWLGTDHLGRDVLSLVMKGTLTSFVVAAIAVVIGAAVGVPLGLAAARWGGIAEWTVLRVEHFLAIFPALIVAILITTLYGPSAANVMVAVGMFNIGAFARVSRESARAISGVDYVAAGRLAGMTPFEVAQRHILPAVASVVAMQAVVQLGIGILAEASLSYAGLGTQPPATSLGLMLKEAQTYALSRPALALIPGLVIVAVVVALNLVVHGLRELIDPKLRGTGATDGAA